MNTRSNMLGPIDGPTRKQIDKNVINSFELVSKVSKKDSNQIENLKNQNRRLKKDIRGYKKTAQKFKIATALGLSALAAIGIMKFSPRSVNEDKLNDYMRTVYGEKATENQNSNISILEDSLSEYKTLKEKYKNSYSFDKDSDDANRLVNLLYIEIPSYQNSLENALYDSIIEDVSKASGEDKENISIEYIPSQIHSNYVSPEIYSINVGETSYTYETGGSDSLANRSNIKSKVLREKLKTWQKVSSLELRTDKPFEFADTMNDCSSNLKPISLSMDGYRIVDDDKTDDLER